MNKLATKWFQISLVMLLSSFNLHVAAHGDGHHQGASHSIKNLMQQNKSMWTGGQPNDADLGYIQAQGIKTIINLRPTDELKGFDEHQAATNKNMQYLQLTIAGKSDITIDNAIALAKLIDSAQGPVFVHCASGNRVGALFALKAKFVDGKSAVEALVIGQQYGMTRLEGHVTSMLSID
jgi:uncharacterized protein (TIGR01244 family)